MRGRLYFRRWIHRYRVVTAGDRNAGRGLTVQNLHCSELGALAGEDPGGDAGGIAGGDGSGSGADLGVDTGRSGGMFPRGMDEGAGNGDGAAFFPLVDGTTLPGCSGGRREPD